MRIPVHGPLEKGAPAVGASCPGCNKKISIGDYIVLLAIGPGANEDARAAARNGQKYEAVAVGVHLACATGEIRLAPAAAMEHLQ